jgi:hypothetical protein
MFDLYDPRYATGGGQPQYFDEWTSMYKRFIVHASKITATVTLTTSTADPCYVVVVPMTNTIDSSWITFGNANPMQLNGARWKLVKRGGDRQTVTVKNYTTMKKMTQLRRTDALKTDAFYYGTSGSSPTGEFLWYVIVYDPGMGVSSTCAAQFSISVKQFSEFYKRKTDIDDS